MSSVTLFDISLRSASVFSALLVHLTVGYWVMRPQPPVVIPQRQIIQMTMVAPNVMEEANTQQETSEQKTSEKTAPLNKNATIERKEKLQPKPVKKKSVQTKQPKNLPQHKEYIQQLTSGLISLNATEKISAITKPVAANYLNNPAPAYPEKARLRGQEGTVLLDVRVNVHGKPKTVHVAKSSGYRLLDKAALDTVTQWTFIPAHRGTVTVEANVEIPITFRIN